MSPMGGGTGTGDGGGSSERFFENKTIRNIELIVGIPLAVVLREVARDMVSSSDPLVKAAGIAAVLTDVVLLLDGARRTLINIKDLLRNH